MDKIQNTNQWKIYYSDGSTFSSNNGTWEEAPDQDVQVVILYYPRKDRLGRPTRSLMSGADYYFRTSHGFSKSFDDFSLVIGVVKFGKWTTDENFESILEKAINDYDI